MKRQIFIGIIILLGFNSCAQDLTCSDFKEGTFYTPSDTMSNSREILIRKGNAQFEYTEEGNTKKDFVYIQLEWIDNCTYRAKYDDSKMELDENEIFMNQHNGMVVKKVNIKGNCLEYIATLTLPNGEEVSGGGKICKE